ncbi:MAG: nucleotidyltransferase family protein [Pseudomonadota bacterium]
MTSPQHTNLELWSIVLAAGAGRRMPGIKPLAQVSGRPIIEFAIELGRVSSNQRCIVVGGAYTNETLVLIGEHGCALAQNDRWASGMGSSIACGVKALPSSATHCLVLLVDQPLVRTFDITRLIGTSNAHPDSIIVSSFAETSGPPAIFPRRTFCALERLDGDVGAKSLVQADRSVQRVDVPAAQWDADDTDSLNQINARL